MGGVLARMKVCKEMGLGNICPFLVGGRELGVG